MHSLAHTHTHIYHRSTRNKAKSKTKQKKIESFCNERTCVVGIVTLPSISPSLLPDWTYIFRKIYWSWNFIDCLIWFTRQRARFLVVSLFIFLLAMMCTGTRLRYTFIFALGVPFNRRKKNSPVRSQSHYKVIFGSIESYNFFFSISLKTIVNRLAKKKLIFQRWEAAHSVFLFIAISLCRNIYCAAIYTVSSDEWNKNEVFFYFAIDSFFIFLWCALFRLIFSYFIERNTNKTLKRQVLVLFFRKKKV